MDSIGYYNGTFAPPEELMVPALDRGYYFGDGVYEALRVENHVPFELEAHLDRLEHSLAALKINFDMPRDALRGILAEVCRRVESETQLLYFQITRGTGPRSHSFDPAARPNLLVFARHSPLADVETPKKATFVPDIRWSRCDLKTINLLPSVMAAQRAAERGCSEAIFERDGIVSECASANLFLLKNGELRTAPADSRILAGVTRARLILLASELGVPVSQQAFSVQDALAADELIVTSTSVHCASIGEIDQTPVGGKDPVLLKKLQTAFRVYFHSAVG
ncbi:MAG TPA: aminotransferase class IV [Eubacteriales bacterium]|nr:aminotransferase class IV [Eubacteriales bacterium]